MIPPVSAVKTTPGIQTIPVGSAGALSAPPVGKVDFGDLRRRQPFSRVFGFDRGQCIDRYYIEHFLAQHSADIRGRVLEVADSEYTRRFGGDRVTHSDVLHVSRTRRATLVADLTRTNQFPHDAFDCIILTQTLQVIYDIKAAVSTLSRILKCGGVVLTTVPGICQISRYDMDRWGDFWRFTTLAARRLFEEAFPAENVEVKAYGNVLAATAFLYGLVAEDLRDEELLDSDQDYELLITVRAWRPNGVLNKGTAS